MRERYRVKTPRSHITGTLLKTTVFLILFVARYAVPHYHIVGFLPQRKTNRSNDTSLLIVFGSSFFFLSTGRHQNVSLSMSAEFRRNEYWRRRHRWLEIYRNANSYSFFEKMVIIVIEIRTGWIYISGLINYLSFSCILFDDLLFNHIHLSSKRLNRKKIYKYNYSATTSESSFMHRSAGSVGSLHPKTYYHFYLY